MRDFTPADWSALTVCCLDTLERLRSRKQDAYGQLRIKLLARATPLLAGQYAAGAESRLDVADWRAIYGAVLEESNRLEHALSYSSPAAFKRARQLDRLLELLGASGLLGSDQCEFAEITAPEPSKRGRKTGPHERRKNFLQNALDGSEE